MASERLYDGKKIKRLLDGAGKRVEGLSDYLDMCAKNGWTLIGTGKLPKRHARNLAVTEARLVEYLGVTSIEEILWRPKADRAA
jgi:hypothetical protein